MVSPYSLIVFSLAIGFVLSLLGSIVLFLGQITIFAILYGLGTVVSLAGTGFLIGVCVGQAFRSSELTVRSFAVLHPTETGKCLVTNAREGNLNADGL